MPKRRTEPKQRATQDKPEEFASLEEIRTTYLPRATAGLATDTLDNPRRTGSVLASHLIQDLAGHIKTLRKARSASPAR
jgi:hypothetical protein